MYVCGQVKKEPKECKLAMPLGRIIAGQQVLRATGVP